MTEVAAPPPLPYRRLNPPERTLLGPDLSNASPRARQGLIGVLEGANDPNFLAVLEEAIARLCHIWGTDNADTYLIPGSEETALEAALLNALQPGETAVVASSGFFGERLAEAAERCGAHVIRVVAPAGEAVSREALRDALGRQPTRLLATLHGDGSTGVQQAAGRPGRAGPQRTAPCCWSIPVGRSAPSTCPTTSWASISASPAARKRSALTPVWA